MGLSVGLRRRQISAPLLGLLLAGCGKRAFSTPAGMIIATGVGGEPALAAPAPVPPVPVEARGYTPILCYHRVREWEDDDEESRPYIIQPALLARHVRYLRDEGYTSGTAAQVHAHYAFGTPLPSKPVLLSFDSDRSAHGAVKTRPPRVGALLLLHLSSPYGKAAPTQRAARMTAGRLRSRAQREKSHSTNGEEIGSKNCATGVRGV